MRSARISVAAGLLALCMTVASLFVSPQTPCGGPPSHPPILSLELARGRADLQELFGPPGACRDQLEHGLRRVNQFDYAFMLAYGSLLFFAVAAGRRTAPSLARWGMAAAVGGVVCDAAENLCLLSLNIDAPEPWLLPLAVATRGKFVLLALTSLVLAVEMWRGERRVWRALSAAHFLPLFAVLPAIVDSRWLVLLTPAFAASWVVALAWMGSLSVGDRGLR